MKRWLKYGLITGVIIILALIISFLSYKSPKCSQSYPENCKVSCTTDTDCKNSGACGCININEELVNEGIPVACFRAPVCKCVENKCKDVPN